MFGISSKIVDFIGVISLVGVLSYGFYTKGFESFSSGEFWLLSIVLFVQIKHIIPEGIKSFIIYNCNKIFSGKYFDVNLQYSIKFSSEIKDRNGIFLLLEDSLRGENKGFIKSSDGNFTFGDGMKIRYEYDAENNEQYLHIVISSNKYTISSLEKDIHYYKKIFGIIKDSFQIEGQSMSSTIMVDSFYTPEYLLKRYSKGYDQLEVKIENNISIKRNIDHEVLLIDSGGNIDDFTDKLKKYIKLTL